MNNNFDKDQLSKNNLFRVGVFWNFGYKPMDFIYFSYCLMAIASLSLNILARL